MEDIQDGIKVSIQDGVEEDPTAEEKLDPRHKSLCGVIYIVTELTCPTIETELATSTDSIAKTASISTILETAVV